jgi:hypothetical protein
MQHSVAIYGKLLLVIGVMGYLAGGTAVWSAIGPALLGIIVLAVTRGPLRTSSATVAGTAGTLIAMLALCSSANAVADIPAVMAGDPAVDGLMTLSRSLTALVSLAILFALAAHWLQGGSSDEDLRTPPRM